MTIDIRRLKTRKWPAPAFPIGQEVAGRIKGKNNGTISLYDDNGVLVEAKKGYSYEPIAYPGDYHGASYIHEKGIRMMPLASEIIPGSSGISGMVNVEGLIYGITCGEEAHLFSYSEEDGIVKDIGIACRGATKTSIAAISGDIIYMASSSEEANCLYVRQNGNIRTWALNIKGGIVFLHADRRRGLIYGLSGSGEFFVFEHASSRLIMKHDVDSEGIFSSVLAGGADGKVYGVARWGRLYCYDHSSCKINALGINAPSIKGREFYNKVDCLLMDEESNIIYGGTSADGILFKLDLNSMRMISMGKPFNQPHIRCLVLGDDKSLYGIAGENCCHLFRYDTRCGDLSDLGMFHVKTPRFWHGYEFDTAVKGDSGKIYFGENDRISHLFMYFPPGKNNQESLCD